MVSDVKISETENHFTSSQINFIHNMQHKAKKGKNWQKKKLDDITANSDNNLVIVQMFGVTVLNRMCCK